MKRWIILAISLASVTAHAQVLTPTPQTVAHAGTVCFQASDTSGTDRKCASWPMSQYPTVTMQVTGTFSGTITFEATADGQTWFAVDATNIATQVAATTTTSTGQFAIPNTGLVAFRARGSSWASGAANITLTRGVSVTVK